METMSGELDQSEIEQAERRENRLRAVDEAKVTAMPLTFGRVFWAVFLANLLSAIVFALMREIR